VTLFTRAFCFIPSTSYWATFTESRRDKSLRDALLFAIR
jgi:hypothetical protein